jgi:hypothetical protein
MSKYELVLLEEFEVKNIIEDKRYADRKLLDYTIGYQIKALFGLARKYMLHDRDALITDIDTKVLNVNNQIYPDGVVVITTAKAYRKKKVEE